MDRKPAEVCHPGEHLADELNARHLFYEDFCDDTGFQLGTMIGLLGGDIDITPEIADGLSNVLGMSAFYWLNLQRAWDDFQERSK